MSKEIRKASMKKLFFLIVFLFIGILTVYAANWVEVDIKKYADVSSIAKYNDIYGKNNVYSIWTKDLNDGSDIFKDIEKTLGKQIWYTLTMRLFDCDNKTISAKSYVDYDLKDNVIDSYTYSYIEWRPVVPNSYGEALYQGVCAYKVNSTNQSQGNKNVRIILKDARSK